MDVKTPIYNFFFSFVTRDRSVELCKLRYITKLHKEVILKLYKFCLKKSISNFKTYNFKRSEKALKKRSSIQFMWKQARFHSF